MSSSRTGSKEHWTPTAAAIAVAALAGAVSGLTATATRAELQYDAILEWTGPYFRAIRAPQDQATDTPVLDVAFLTPYSVAAREHDSRDVVYVLDSGNRRVQAFEVNAKFEYLVNSDLSYRSSGSAQSAEWSGDEIRLPGWALTATEWIVPRSEEVVIDGVTWSWVSDLTDFDATDEVYTIDYDAVGMAPRILFPSGSLGANSSFRVTYLLSDNQTGAADAYGIGEVDYGIGEGASPVLAEIDGTSGGPVSFQSLRGLGLIRNESDSTSDDVFLVDYADDSGNLDESLLQYTVASDGTVTFVEAFSDSLVGPYDVAVARSAASSTATVSVSSDTGLFDQSSAAVVDANQVTGHTYSITITGSDAYVDDLTTGRTIVSQDLISVFADPFYLIPGLELRTQVPTGSTTISTTRARPKRYLFVAETDADRVTVISAADGASFTGDWLPLDDRSVITQPGILVGGAQDVDYSESTPGSVPANWSHFTATAPIADGTLDSLEFAVDGTWSRVESLGGSGPTDKVYTLNNSTGRIRFGDGTNGALPPASEEFTYTYSVTPVVLRYGSTGTGDGTFSGPKGISARWNGTVGGYDVYVADTGNNRIQKLRFYGEDPALGLAARMEFITDWNYAGSVSDTLLGPTDVVVRADTESPANVWVAVADTGNDRFVLYEDVAAGAVGDSYDAPTYELTLGTTGSVLGAYQNPVAVEFLSNDTALDIYTVDASRGIVAKYEKAPDPTVSASWDTAECYGPHGSYTFTFATVNPPTDGWVDFYFDTAATFSEVTADLAITAGSVGTDDGTAVWVFDDTPSGAPSAGTYYLYAVMRDSGGEIVDIDQTTSDETLCIDATIVPTLALQDAIDGDGTLYFQAGSTSILRLVVANPDSVVSVGYEATFDPTVLEVVSITQGTAWDGVGATAVIFEQRKDNILGTFAVSSSAVDTPIGLTGTGPYNIADIQLRPRAGQLDLVTRFVESSVQLKVSGTSMSDGNGQVSGDLTISGLDVRLAYLGDIATVDEGAGGEVGSLTPNPDGYIDFSDVMAFTLGWNGANFERDPIADIGPATGTPPDLVSEPDGEWNVDDLIVLSQMYSWASSMGFSRFGRPTEGNDIGGGIGARFDTGVGAGFGAGNGDDLGSGVDVGVDNGPATSSVTGSDRTSSGWSPRFTSGNPESVRLSVIPSTWAPGDIVTVELSCPEQANVLGADVAIAYSPGSFEVVDAETGNVLQGSEGQLFFRDTKPDWVGLTAARLGEPTTQFGASESEGALVSIRLRALTIGPVPLTIRHELRDTRNQLVARDVRTWPDGAASPELRLVLDPPVPNPMRDSSTIRFVLPRAGDVRLRVFDVGGRSIGTLLREEMDAGEHTFTFDGRAAEGQVLVPGVYYTRLEADGRSTSQKLVIVR
ncbi:MAG: FlgD immunoglobulin-like domain containing protein [Candidatus Eisenbacteria bacterium]